MISHPGTTAIHELLKSIALLKIIRTGVQKNNNLVARKKFFIKIVPIIGGVITEIIFRSHCRKPSISLVNKADVCCIILSRIKGDYLE